MREKLTNFQERTLFGSLGSVIVATAILLSHQDPFQYFFLFMLTLVQAVALWEYYKIATIKEFRPLTWIGITFSSAYIILRYLTLESPHYTFYSELLLYAFGLTSFIAYFKRQDNAIGNLGVTVFGFLYITFPLSLFLDINYGMGASIADQSPLWLIFLVVATKMTDTCAYFTGKKYGKKQIAPLLSPQKTVEGMIGGLLGATLVGMTFKLLCVTFGLTLVPNVTFLEAALIGFFIGITGVLGDLAESLLKRDAKVKDSNCLPGFGGVLDIVDSNLFTTPILYIYLRSKLLLYT